MHPASMLVCGRVFQCMNTSLSWPVVVRVSVTLRQVRDRKRWPCCWAGFHDVKKLPDTASMKWTWNGWCDEITKHHYKSLEVTVNCSMLVWFMKAIHKALHHSIQNYGVCPIKSLGEAVIRVHLSDRWMPNPRDLARWWTALSATSAYGS